MFYVFKILGPPPCQSGLVARLYKSKVNKASQQSQRLSLAKLGNKLSNFNLIDNIRHLPPMSLLTTPVGGLPRFKLKTTLPQSVGSRSPSSQSPRILI